MDVNGLHAALSASPENVPLLVLIARHYLDQFDIEKATKHLDDALKLEPENTEVQYLMAKGMSLDGKISMAMVRLESICQTNPEYADAWLLRASLLVTENDGQSARACYDKAIGINPDLKNEKLLKDIIKAGGEFGNKSPELDKDDAENEFGMESGYSEFDEDSDDSIPSLDGVMAHDLEVDLQLQTEKSFKDIGGMEDVKEEIKMKIIYPLQKPELFSKYGKTAGGGVLLYGPPGCGKTLMSLATAGEIKSTFLNVGLHQVLNMYIGESESRLHEIFELARRHKPCVLFFDEIDALAADRRDMRQSGGRFLINQFLNELDGAKAENEGVLILGATNAPWHVDNAFLRPGRFDRVIFVPPPDLKARSEIAKIHTNEKPVVQFDKNEFAKKTEGFSGADIRSVFERATESALMEAMKKGGEVVPITGKSLIKATKSIRPSTKKWFESAKNYALYANQDGLYDDILSYLKMNK